MRLVATVVGAVLAGLAGVGTAPVGDVRAAPSEVLVYTTHSPPFSYANKGLSLVFCEAMIEQAEGKSNFNYTFLDSEADMEQAIVSDSHPAGYDIVIAASATPSSADLALSTSELPPFYADGLYLATLDDSSFWDTVADVVRDFSIILAVAAVFSLVMVFVAGTAAWVSEMMWPVNGYPIFMVFADERGKVRAAKEIGMALKWAALCVVGTQVGKPASKQAVALRTFLIAYRGALFIVLTAALTALVTTVEPSTTVQSYDQLNGRTLCCVENTASCEYAYSHNNGYTVIEKPGVVEIVNAIFTRQCDAGLHFAVELAYEVTAQTDDNGDKRVVFTGDQLTNTFLSMYMNASTGRDLYRRLSSSTLDLVNDPEFMAALESTYIPPLPEAQDTDTSFDSVKLAAILTVPVVVGISVLTAGALLIYSNVPRVNLQRKKWLAKRLDSEESQNWPQMLRELAIHDANEIFERTEDKISVMAWELRRCHKLALRSQLALESVAAKLGAKRYTGAITHIGVKRGVNQPGAVSYSGGDGGPYGSVSHDPHGSPGSAAHSAGRGGGGGTGGHNLVTVPGMRLSSDTPRRPADPPPRRAPSRDPGPGDVHSATHSGGGAAITATNNGDGDNSNPDGPSLFVTMGQSLWQFARESGVPHREADSRDVPHGSSVLPSSGPFTSNQLHEAVKLRVWKQPATVRAGTKSFPNLREWVAVDVEANDPSIVAQRLLLCTQLVFRSGIPQTLHDYDAMVDVYTRVVEIFPGVVLEAECLDEAVFLRVWGEFMQAVDMAMPDNELGTDWTCTPVHTNRNGLALWWLDFELLHPSERQQQSMPGPWTTTYRSFPQAYTGTAAFDFEDLQESGLGPRLSNAAAVRAGAPAGGVSGFITRLRLGRRPKSGRNFGSSVGGARGMSGHSPILPFRKRLLRGTTGATKTSALEDATQSSGKSREPALSDMKVSMDIEQA